MFHYFSNMSHIIWLILYDSKQEKKSGDPEKMKKNFRWNDLTRKIFDMTNERFFSQVLEKSSYQALI